MAQYDLYIDVVAGALISSLQNPQTTNPPPLVQGDNPTWRIWLCNPTGDPRTPYTLIPIAGLSLQVAIGDKVGNTTNYYTQQFTWAPSADPANPNYFIAQLPLNTAAITTLLGSGASANSTLQVVYIQGGFPTTVLEIQVTIQAAVIKNGGVIVPPGATFLSAETAAATYLKRTIVGAIILQNPNGKQVALFCDADGSFKADPLN